MKGKWKQFCSTSRKSVSANHAYNRSLFEGISSSLINGQNTEPVRTMRYGRNCMHHCGCEIIAVYNIMQLLEMPQPLPDVISEFELNHLSLLFFSTFFGSSPGKIRRYFDAHKIEYSYLKTKDEFIKQASSSHIGIVSFWVNTYSKHRFNRFGSGLHAVAFQSDDTGKLTVYNRYNDDTAPREYDSMDDLLQDRRFISGYLFKNPEK
ncbi:hypothetical protein [Ruminococcus sp. FC2018]|uniref:hypothetical protein n=1 Tax=Ruminococcus sp. FC2018 TaxID=1410617 RepID=UPI00048A93C2|nr:hypothetical protein [Ruminococcus sp. FC2018]